MKENDRARHVLVALGGPVERLVLGEDSLEQAAIVDRYGERFRDAKIVRFSTPIDYDDSGYSSYSDQWALVAADVDDPTRVIAECFMQELRENGLRGDDGLLSAELSVGDYACVCDDGLLFMRGVVFMGRAQPQRTLQSALSQSEMDEVWGVF